MGPKRSKDQIIAKILETCNDQAASMTVIVYVSGMNYRTIKPYIAMLTKNGLLEIKDGDPVLYRSTSKGAEALDHLRALEALIPDLRSSGFAD